MKKDKKSKKNKEKDKNVMTETAEAVKEVDNKPEIESATEAVPNPAPVLSTAVEPEQASSEPESSRLQKLEAELDLLKIEIRKLKNQAKASNRWFYKEFIKSPVLGDLVNVYLENEKDAALYDAVRSYVEMHDGDKDKMQVELIAEKEVYKGDNLASLATASGILSIAGIVYAAAGAGSEMGVLIVLFIVLAALSVYVGIWSAKNAACRRLIEYILAVYQMIERDKK